MTATSSVSSGSDAARDSFAWLTPLRFGLGLAFTLILVYPAVVAGVGTFVARDYGLFTAPMALYQRDCFWSGEFPLWNPYSHCGIPHLAQWNTSTLYPLSLIYLVLPFTWGLGLLQLLHLWMAGMGMYFLAQRLTGHRLAAAVAGTIFAWNGLSVNCLYWVSNLAALAWMPWVVWLVEEGWRRGGRWLVAGVVVGVVQMLSGAPEIILLTWLVLAGLWAGSSWQERSKASLYTRRLVGMGLWIGCLAAVQILPFWQLLGQSLRGEYGAENIWPMPALGWADFLVPFFQVFPVRSDTSYQYDQYWTYSYYVGMVPWVLAGLGGLLADGKRRWFWAGCALLGAVLALGDHGLVLPWLQAYVPGFKFFRYPIKLVSLTVFALPLLAAQGVAVWLRHPQRKRVERLALGLTLVLAGAVVLIVWYGEHFPMPQDVPGMVRHSGWQAAAFLLGGTFLAGLLVRRSQKPEGWLWAVVLLGVVWADLLIHKPQPHAVVPSSALQTEVLANEDAFSPRPVLGEARVMVNPALYLQLHDAWLENPVDNYLLARGTMFLNVNLLERVPTVMSFYSLYPRYNGIFLNNVYGRKKDPPPGLLAFLGVRFYQESAPPYHFQAQTNALPWITAGQAVEYANNPQMLEALNSPQFKPLETAYFPSDAKDILGERGRAVAQVTQWTFHRQQVVAEVESDRPTVLLVAQSWYPAWHATVNGNETKLWRANYAFQGVAIPAGKSTVVLEYRDRWFQTGLCLSVLAALGLSGFAWRAWHKPA